VNAIPGTEKIEESGKKPEAPELSSSEALAKEN
jgi:hypothetical protein